MAVKRVFCRVAAYLNKWVNPSSGGKPLDTGSEMFVGSFSRHIQVLREGGLEVVIVFDSTASMSRCLREVKLKIKSLASAFKKLVPTCRIGLVTYRDHKEKYLTKQLPLTYSILSLHDFLADISTGGGRDIREAVAQGLKVAIDEMNWNKKSKKFVLLIGDAPPHIEDLPWGIELVNDFREQMGGVLSVIDVRQPKDMTREQWNRAVLPFMKDPEIESYEFLTGRENVMNDFLTLAQVGGGESARLINEEKVMKNMLLLIFGTRWEMYLDEFMKNL